MAIPQIVSEVDIQVSLGINGSPTANEQLLIALTHGASEGAVKKFLGYDPVRQEHIEFYPARTAAGRAWHGFDDDHYHYDSDGVMAFPHTWHDTGVEEMRKLVVQHIPIRVITEIREDLNAKGGSQAGDFPIETLLAATEYFLDGERDCNGAVVGESGIVWRDRSVWAIRERSIKITYTAGYSANEFQGFSDKGLDDCLDASPIRQATLLTAIQMFRRLCAIQKNNTGFLGPYESERLGDYSYKLGGDLAKQFGLLEGEAIPGVALSLLEPFEHFAPQLL